MNDKLAVGSIGMDMHDKILKIKICESDKIIITDDITYYTRIKRQNELRSNASDLIYDIRYCADLMECLLELDKVLADIIENTNGIRHENTIHTIQPEYGTSLAQMMMSCYIEMRKDNDYVFNRTFMIHNDDKNPISLWKELKLR